jgi:hypothetical protein
MKILLIILFQIPLTYGLLFAQFKADTLYDFKNKINDGKDIFIRTITTTQQQMLVSLRHDYADNYVFQSNDNGTNFALIVKDTTPYTWTKDSMKAREFPGSAIPYCAVAVDNDIFMSRTGGIISKIDYKNNKFINDTIFGTSSIVRSLDYNDNTILTCAGFNVFKSHDKGQTWQQIAPDISKFDYDTSFYLTNSNIKVIDNNIYYLLTKVSNYSGYYNSTYFMKTVDGGISWQIVTKITGGTPLNFTITPNHNIFISGAIVINNEKPPNYYYEWMIKSTDDGLTWKEVIGNPEKFNGSLNHVKFYNNNFGVSYHTGFLYYTFDGGDTWDYLYAPTEFGISIWTVEFLDDKTVLIGDMKLGLILKLALDPTSVEYNYNNENNYFVNIYPNPATEYITITKPSEGFEPSEGSEIQIFNMLGECVMTVGAQLAVPLQRIDISHLPTGVYYIRVGNSTKMFVKI